MALTFAVIFDLNGTLVNTEIAFFTSYKEALSPFGIPFTITDFTTNWSTHGKKLKDYLILIGREDLLSQEQEIMARKDRVFEQIFEEKSSLLPGAKVTIQQLKNNHVPLGLDSSNARHNIDRLLQKFGLDGMFDAIASFDMDLDEQTYGEKKKKSSRLKAVADMLNFSPQTCIMIGDAEKDIKGAKDAGMKAIAIPSEYTKTNDFSRADKIISSLSEITIDMFTSCI